MWSRGRESVQGYQRSGCKSCHCVQLRHSVKTSPTSTEMRRLVRCCGCFSRSNISSSLLCFLIFWLMIWNVSRVSMCVCIQWFWFDCFWQVEAEKPNPTIFLKACELLGVNPEDAVHVGDDRRNDLWGARDAGCDAWLWGSEVTSFKQVNESPLLPQASQEFIPIDNLKWLFVRWLNG